MYISLYTLISLLRLMLYSLYILRKWLSYPLLKKQQPRKESVHVYSRQETNIIFKFKFKNNFLHVYCVHIISTPLHLYSTSLYKLVAFYFIIIIDTYVCKYVYIHHLNPSIVAYMYMYVFKADH